jgi:hypothetical protein
VHDPNVAPRPSEGGEPGSVDAVLGRVASGAEELAAAIEAFPGEEWPRAVHLPRTGVHAGVHRLRQAERVVDQVRGRP